MKWWDNMGLFTCPFCGIDRLPNEFVMTFSPDDRLRITCIYCAEKWKQLRQ